MAREYFCAYHSYLAAMEPLNDAERGRLFTALLTYSQSGGVPQLTGNERFIFPSLREQIDRDAKKYAAKCERNRENVMKRYSNEYGRSPSYSFATKTKTNTKTRTKTNERENARGLLGPLSADKPPRTLFSPPTVDDVSEYCTEKGIAIDPESFVDYYETNGWMAAGKSPMKDWKAAVRRWARLERDKPDKGNERWLD